MRKETPTVQEIKRMGYTDFISLIRETNRCPGGKETIRKILINTFINKDSSVLEVGANTGFTSLEVAHSVGCTVHGIDISQSCIETANDILQNDYSEIKKKVSFHVASAYDIPFEDNKFDLLIAGGATSFMANKEKALSEYLRVVKPWGFISVTQLFYAKSPPQSIVNTISNILGVQIHPWGEQEWLELYSNHSKKLELYYYEKNTLSPRKKDYIDQYIEFFMNKPHLKVYPKDIRKAIEIKWREYVEAFNANHKYLGFFIAVFRKSLYTPEPELFSTTNE